MLPWQLYYIAKMSSCFENVTDFVTHDINSWWNGIILVKLKELVENEKNFPSLKAWELCDFRQNVCEIIL